MGGYIGYYRRYYIHIYSSAHLWAGISNEMQHAPNGNAFRPLMGGYIDAVLYPPIRRNVPPTYGRVYLCVTLWQTQCQCSAHLWAGISVNRNVTWIGKQFRPLMGGYIDNRATDTVKQSVPPTYGRVYHKFKSTRSFSHGSAHLWAGISTKATSRADIKRFRPLMGGYIIAVRVLHPYGCVPPTYGRVYRLSWVLYCSSLSSAHLLVGISPSL